MSLSISPEHYLSFEHSTTESSTTITLTNPHDTNILFKIRTTAPKSYTVKPAHGEITPKSKLEITIDFHPPSSSKDKFLVMSTRSKQWDDTATHEHKMRVKFADLELNEKQDDKSVNTSSVASPQVPNIIQTPPSDKNLNKLNAGSTAVNKPTTAASRPISTVSSAPQANTASTEDKSNLATNLVLDLQLKMEEYKNQIALISGSKSPASPSQKSYKQVDQKGIPMSMVLVLMVLAFLVGSWLF